MTDQSAALATQVNLSDSRLPVKVETMQDLQVLGKILFTSGFFKDVNGAQQAVVKVLAGAEIGLGPVASMTSIHIIESKPSFSSNLIASKIKSHPNYNYIVKKLTDTGCTIEILEYDSDGKPQSIGDFTFGEKDAKAANLLGKNNWKNYPRAMYFSRAISQAARVYCPDVFHSVIPYTVEELAPDIELTEHGDVVEGQINVPVEIKAKDEESKTKTEEPVVEAEDTTNAETKDAPPSDSQEKEPPGPPEGKPWMDPALSIQENRNILYGVAVAEWGYEDTDAVRETIVEANRWIGKTPIPTIDVLDEIATHLLEQSPEPVKED